MADDGGCFDTFLASDQQARSHTIFKRLLILIIPLVLIAAACSSSSSDEGSSGSMTIQDGDIVELHYVLTLEDGTKVDSSRDRGTPFSFTVGSGQVITGFDIAVKGLSVGDVKTTEIQPSDGYGEWDETRVIELPIAPSQSDVAVGDQVFLSTGQPVTVIAIEGDTATVDANHELAGKVLTFEIEILGVTRPE